MKYRLALKNTFLHVKEVEFQRARATSDLTDVMLEEAVERRQTAEKIVEETLQKSELRQLQLGILNSGSETGSETEAVSA
jgi:hypothetical protein